MASAGAYVRRLSNADIEPMLGEWGALDKVVRMTHAWLATRPKLSQGRWIVSSVGGEIGGSAWLPHSR